MVSPSVYGESFTDFIPQNWIPIRPGHEDQYGMNYYDEGNGGWYYIDNSNIGQYSFSRGIGYLLRKDISEAVTFFGTLNYGQQLVHVTRTGNGWNCIGNPYSSSIGLTGGTTTEDFLTYNAVTNHYIDPSFAYVYVVKNGAYYKINNTTHGIYALPGQGFMIKAAADGERCL